jgi:transcriptional regulator with XRE-family HTH domain
MKDSKSVLNEYRSAIENLKKALKEKRITYAQMAQDLGLSESGIKKIFAARDGSFQRLVQIAKYVGLSVAELVEDTRSTKVGFTDKEQSEFLKDVRLFHAYWMLVYERASLEQVQAGLKISKAEAFKLARKLDALNLIKLLPGDRVLVPAIQVIHWDTDGEFIRKIYKEWSRGLVSDVAKPKSTDGEYFLIRYLQMTKKTYADFIAAQEHLADEFIRRSIQEMRTQSTGLEHVRWLIAADNRSFVNGQRR